MFLCTILVMYIKILIVHVSGQWYLRYKPSTEIGKVFSAHDQTINNG